MNGSGLPPGVYFRLLLVGYFEGIDSERGIAWRAADSFALRDFLGVGLQQAPPDHSTISRTRRLIALETHRAIFTWVLQCLSTAGLVKGKTIGIDATTLEANAALRSIEEVVADKGYHSRTTVHDLETLEIRTYISEPDRGHQSWTGQEAERDAVHANRRRIRSDRGKRSSANVANCSGDRVRISTRLGGLRRAHVRGHENVLKRLLVHAGAFNPNAGRRSEPR